MFPLDCPCTKIIFVRFWFNLNSLASFKLLFFDIMRIRIGIIMAYLLLGCLLLEDALPYFAMSNTMEMSESKTESGEKDTQKEKEIEDESNEVKDMFHFDSICYFSFVTRPGNILADSDEIPDSANQSIFSPPPDLV
jgi:hypothetical protein